MFVALASEDIFTPHLRDSSGQRTDCRRCGYNTIEIMKIRICFALLFLLLVPVSKGISQSIELEGIGGAMWAGKYISGRGIPHFKYAGINVGSSFNYQILKHSFLTSGLFYGQAGDYDTRQIRSWSMPFQWSQRYGKKVQVQLGMGMYVALLRYHFGDYYRYIGGVDPLIRNGSEEGTRFDFGFAGTASVYVPITKIFAIKAGVNQNWGLKKQMSQDTVGSRQNTTALFLGLSFKLKT